VGEAVGRGIGTWGGRIIGGTIGSVEPGGGTIVGGIIGGAVGGRIGGAVGGAIGDFCIAQMATIKEKERCKKVRLECIKKCSTSPPLGEGGRTNQGMPFFRCVNKCLEDEGCPTP